MDILQKLISPKFTQDVVMDMLRKESGYDKVSITDINFGTDLKKGESYMSSVTKFSIDFEYWDGNGSKSKTIHVLVKSLIKNVARRETFRSAEFFVNESSFYDKVWPLLDAFQKSKKPKEMFIEVPKCLATFIDGVDDYVALEDLVFAGYKVAERAFGLDSNHVNLVIKIFARFHALSMAYKQENPDGFKEIDNSLQETYFSEKHRKWYVGYQAKLNDVVRDAVSQELPEIYLTKLNALFNTDLYGKLIESCAERGLLSVVTHGDAWLPNFLLRYDEKHTPLHAMMIDFQLTRVSSLALDLHFFLYSCADSDFLNNHYEETLDYYCENFNAFLKDLGCTNFLTKQVLLNELRRHGAFSVAMAIEAVVVSMLDDDEVADFDQMQGDKAVPVESVLLVYPLKTKEKRQRVATFIKHAIDNQFI